MKTNTPRWIGLIAAAAMTLVVYLTVGERMRLEGLAGAAGNSASLQGMIGKATNTQQKLGRELKGLEAAAVPGASALEAAQKLHDSAAKDLQVAFNLMNASGGASTEIVGWYYAAQNIQKKNDLRLQALVQKAGADSPSQAAEEAPADGYETAAASE